MQHDPVEQVFELLADGNRAEALARLNDLLREEPYHGMLYALRALLYTDVDRLEEAEADATRALELVTDHPFVHYARGVVGLQRGDMMRAIESAHSARELAPDYSYAILLEARARAAMGQWDRVGDLAAGVAEVEPENEEAALLATIAREHRNDGPLSPTAWKGLAQRFPLNAVARTGAGWTRLDAGQIQAARSEFEHALTLDPSLPWAKEGLALALKARNPVYALLLRFFLWFGRLPSRTRTMVLVGGFLGYNVLRRAAADYPDLGPFIVPVLVAYVVFLALSWLADPLLNLMLLARPEGRRLLGGDDRQAAILVGACLGLAGVLALAGWLGPSALLLSAFGVGFTSFAVAAAYGRRGRRRSQLKALAGASVVAALAVAVVPDALQGLVLVTAILCVTAATWLSHFGSDDPATR